MEISRYAEAFNTQCCIFVTFTGPKRRDRRQLRAFPPPTSTTRREGLPRFAAALLAAGPDKALRRFVFGIQSNTEGLALAHAALHDRV